MGRGLCLSVKAHAISLPKILCDCGCGLWNGKGLNYTELCCCFLLRKKKNVEIVFATCCIMKQIWFFSRKKVQKTLFGSGVFLSDHGGLQLEHWSELANVDASFSHPVVICFPLSLAKCCLSHLFCFMSALSNLDLIFVVQQVLQISKLDALK